MSSNEFHGNVSLHDTRVDIYRNLHEDCYSILCRETGTREYGSVIAHTDGVSLRDAEFVVQDAGQAKCRETGVKNVHAVVRGHVNFCFDSDQEAGWGRFDSDLVENDTSTIVSVRYDPFECDHFEISEIIGDEQADVQVGDKIEEAVHVSLGPSGVRAQIR